MASTKTPVVLYRGLSENYNAETHKNGVYFATDANEIYLSMDIKSMVDGEEVVNTVKRTYGSKEIITNVVLSADGTKLEISKQGSETAEEILISNFRPGIELNYISAADNAEKGYAELQLKAANGDILTSVDATPFVKDGFLKSVNVEKDDEGDNDYLVFTWNTDAEITETKIKLSDIVGDVKLDSSNLLLGQELTVAGLAGDKIGAGNITSGKVYSKDTSIYQILTDLLCKELWAANPRYTEGNLTSSYAAPSISFTAGGKTVNANAIVEIDTVITIAEVSGTALSNTPTSRTYAGFDHGYSADEFVDSDGNGFGDSGTYTVVDGNPSSVAVGNITAIEATNTKPYSLAKVYTGFGKSTGDNTTNSWYPATEEDKSKDYKSEVKFSSETVTVAAGSNSVKFTMSGPGHTGSIPASGKYFAASNLGNIQNKAADSNGKYFVDAVGQKDFSTTASSGSKTVAVTGVYPIFINANNYSSSSAAFTDDREPTVKLSLLDTNTFSEIYFPGEVAESINRVSIAYPGNKTISAYPWNDLASSYATESVDFDITETETVYGGVTYKKATVAGGANGAGKWKIVLSSKTSVA